MQAAEEKQGPRVRLSRRRAGRRGRRRRVTHDPDPAAGDAGLDGAGGHEFARGDEQADGAPIAAVGQGLQPADERRERRALDATEADRVEGAVRQAGAAGPFAVPAGPEHAVGRTEEFVVVERHHDGNAAARQGRNDARREVVVDVVQVDDCLLYTSDAADDLLCVDLGGRRIIKKKKLNENETKP